MFSAKHIKSFIIFCTLLSPILHAAEISNLSRHSIYLSESKRVETIRLDVSVKNKHSYFITIQSDNAGLFSADNNEFVLQPTLPGIKGSVRVVFDFPYLERSESGLTRADSINRVTNHQKNRVRDQYSLCPNTSRICKPLTVMVTDDGEAIPGIRYTTTLTITVESDDGLHPPSTKILTLNYQRSGSAIGLKGSTNHVLLTAGNNYTNHVDYCAFSMAYSRFNLSVGSKNSSGNDFYLVDHRANQLPYRVSVSLNNRPGIDVKQDQWVTNGILEKASDASNCRNYNARVHLNIPKEDLFQSSAGIYRDTITVRVKGI